MALQGDPTPAGGPATRPPPRDGVDLTTLFLSAVASAAAAYVTSKIWAPGTLFSAAMSPVIVALVKEGLRKPTEVVAAVVPAAVTRSGRTRNGGTQPLAGSDPLPDDLGEHLERGAPPPYPPPAPGAEAGPVRVYSTRGRRLRWRLAVMTGLLGFAVCVVLYTVPELIAGQSVSDSNSATTFFSGNRRQSVTKKQSTETTTSTSTAPTTTATTPDKTTTEPTPTVTTTVTTPAAPSQTTTTPSATAPGQTPPADTTGTPPSADAPPTATTP